MRKVLIVVASVACVATTLACDAALAKSRAKSDETTLAASRRRTIDVERRSFLDPGKKVPVGSTNRYMVQQTFSNQDPIYANQRSWYMGETLPRRWDQPWSPGVSFESPTFDDE
jgi:Ni/Co efflux regulator RcnB